MCLMEYCCEKCKTIEILWNSRPRVTPFIVKCREENCDGEMNHVNWSNDKYRPNHQPKIGDRIFVDFSKEAHELMCKARIEKYWDDEQYPMSAMFENKQDAYDKMKDDWQFGQPQVITFEK